MGPELQPVAEGFRVPWWKAGFAAMKLTGVIIKMMWAYVWQEQAFVRPGSWVYTPTAMWFLDMLTPHINFFASMLSMFPQDETMLIGRGAYPGSSYCNWHSPHALWHEQSANGFLEVIFLADYLTG